MVPHPLPVWGGICILSGAIRSLGFQSTLPVGGGTCVFGQDIGHVLISIHPPRVGRDLALAQGVAYGY